MKADKIRYVTVFPELLKVHLKKDVGMIPLFMEKYCDYESSILCYNNENSEIDEEDIRKYNIKFIPRQYGDVKDFARYISKHAKEIDVLNIYHITSNRNFHWILAYKVSNLTGKVHLKLDADYNILNFKMYPNDIKNIIKNFVYRHIKLITVESSSLQKELIKKWGIDIKYMPNGYFTHENKQEKSEIKKEKIFLTVGRLGTQQKATEVLMEAFMKIADQTDWKLQLVGTIEEDFKLYITEYFNKYPELISRVEITGNINDQNLLNEYYKKASVFVLPSRWESFGLVLVEALEEGDYLLVSDQIPPANDIIRNNDFGRIVPVDNAEILAREMLEATFFVIDNKFLQDSKKWVVDNFSWEVIVKKLDKYIKDSFKEKK